MVCETVPDLSPDAAFDAWRKKMVERLGPADPVRVPGDSSTHTKSAEELDDSQLLDDERLDAAWNALMAKRATFLLLSDKEPKDFAHHIRGGEWTEKNKGVVADVQGAYAKGGKSIEWCTLYALPMTFGCSLKQYDEADIFKLSEEWCRRMQWFYDRKKESGRTDFVYSSEVLTGYVERAEFFDWAEALPPHSAAKGRVNEIRTRLPHVRPLTIAEQQARKKSKKA